MNQTVSISPLPKTPTTFSVASVIPAKTPLRQESYADALASALSSRAPLEAYSQNTKQLVIGGDFSHSFLHAVNLAYDLHYPLVLSPDMIWLLIAQGFAQHVNANAESLRNKLVSHSGQVKLTVIRDEFVRGFVGNDWEGVFSEFSEQIRSHIGSETHRLIVPRFSTTGIVEQAAFEVTLLDSMQSYFDYTLLTRCGIPRITLEGTTEDWEAIRNAAAELSRFDLTWWTDHLLPVLDQFVAASRGEVDRSFWQGFYKLSNQSGGPYIDGHIVCFFPYLIPKGSSGPYRNTDMSQRNNADDDDSIHSLFRGITFSVLPPAISCAPFLWKYHGIDYPMEFLAGFVGVAQNAGTLALRPEIGWVIREKK